MKDCMKSEGKLSVIKLYSEKGMKQGVELWLECVKLRNQVGAEIRRERGKGQGWGTLARNV